MKLVILDRDGVINKDSTDYIKSPDEWHAIPGSLEAIALLNNAKIKVAIASNQSGLARGYFTEETLQKIHQKMLNELRQYGGHIDKIFYCVHGPKDGCGCRKPKPGLLQQALHYFNIEPQEACFIGDKKTDSMAAIAAGCESIRISAYSDYSNLLEFVQKLLGKTR